MEPEKARGGTEADQASTLSALLDEITSHLFLSGPQGVGENEVWGWLQRVSQEFEAMRGRNRKLATRVAELERFGTERRRLSDDELLAELPGRTARVLRSAQEVGEEIVQRAREQATAVAQEIGQQAVEIRRRAEAEAHSIMRQAEADAQAQLEAARSSGRDMVTQARELRERILSDLSRRRTALEQEVERLEAGRDRLLEAYFAVKRTFDEATSTLAPGVVPPEPEPHLAPRRRLSRGRPPQERRSHTPEAPADHGPAADRAAEEQSASSGGGPQSRYTVRLSPPTNQPTSRTVEEWSRALKT